MSFSFEDFLSQVTDTGMTIAEQWAAEEFGDPNATQEKQYQPVPYGRPGAPPAEVGKTDLSNMPWLYDNIYIAGAPVNRTLLMISGAILGFVFLTKLLK